MFIIVCMEEGGLILCFCMLPNVDYIFAPWKEMQNIPTSPQYIPCNFQVLSSFPVLGSLFSIFSR